MKNVLAAWGFLGLMGAAAWAAPKVSDVLFVGQIEGRSITDQEAQMAEGSVCTAASQDTRFSVRCRDTSKGIAELRKLQAEVGFAEGAPFKDDCGKEGCIGALSAAGDAKWALVGTLAKVTEKQYLLTLQVVDPKTLTQINRIEEKVAGDMAAVVERIPTAVRRVLTPPAKK